MISRRCLYILIYSLLYDSKRKLIGLEILEKSKPGPATPFKTPKNVTRTTNKSMTSEEIKKTKTYRSTNEIS